jgi:hypothetical protein
MQTEPGVIDYHITEDELAGWACPICGTKLRIVESIDPWCCRLSCAKEHMLFCTRKESLNSKSAKAEKAPPMESSDRHAVIRTWLRMPEYRRLLNSQLAMILRRIEEESVYAYDDFESDFKFCPFCGAGLQEFDNHDVWTRGLNCSNGHGFAERGYALGFVREGKGHQIHAEVGSKVLRPLMESWLKHQEKMMREQMHPSIREVFTVELARSSAT